MNTESRNTPLDPHGNAGEQMTLRGYFALAAMQGIVVCEGVADSPEDYNSMARCALQLADATIAALNLPCVTVTATVVGKEG